MGDIQMSRGKRNTGKAIATRLLTKDSERFEQFRKQEGILSSEAARILLRLALDVVFSGKGERHEKS